MGHDRDGQSPHHTNKADGMETAERSRPDRRDQEHHPDQHADGLTEAIENRNTTAEIISQATPVARNNHQGPPSCASVAGVRRGPN
jgi:hypothetical protein